MPFHDLNVTSTSDASALTQTLAFHRELGYSVVALAVAVKDKLPPVLPTVPVPKSQIPDLTILTRLTLTISDTSQNHRLSNLTSQYDIVALRPTNEKSLQLCCASLECDIISLDLSQRLHFPVKFGPAAAALQRGIRFEICYSNGIVGSNDARRNLISGAAALLRATRGRGIIISSETRSALGVRAPWDIINLAQVWGLGQERGKEAVCEEANKAVRLASLKRTSYRGVVNIIDGGAGVATANLITLEGSKNPEDKSAVDNSLSANFLDARTTENQAQHPPNAQKSQSSTMATNPNKAKRKASSISMSQVMESSPLTLQGQQPGQQSKNSDRKDDTSDLSGTVVPEIQQESTQHQSKQQPQEPRLESKPLSKSAMKRRAKKARLEK